MDTCMFKKMLLIFSCILMIWNLNYSHNETKLFSGSIEFPCLLNYDLCLFYQGQKLEFEHSSASPFIQFSFIDSKDVQTVYVLITNNLTCCTQESNTVECLCVVDNSSYVCYKMQAKREFFNKDEDQMLTWDICEHHLDNGQIPANTLIFLFDPSLIAGLKIQSWKPENLFRIIPTIVINPTASTKQIKRAMTIARLAALDIDAIHAKSNSLTNPTHAILTAMQ